MEEEAVRIIYFLQLLSVPAPSREDKSTAIVLPWQLACAPARWVKTEKGTSSYSNSFCRLHLELYHPGQTTGLFIKNHLIAMHLSLCSQQKREKERRAAFFSPLYYHLFLLDSAYWTEIFAMIGFFDMYCYCFSSERRRWLKIKWIVHYIATPALKKVILSSDSLMLF